MCSSCGITSEGPGSSHIVVPRTVHGSPGRSHQSRGTGQNPHSTPAAHSSMDAAQSYSQSIFYSACICALDCSNPHAVPCKIIMVLQKKKKKEELIFFHRRTNSQKIHIYHNIPTQFISFFINYNLFRLESLGLFFYCVHLPKVEKNLSYVSCN